MRYGYFDDEQREYVITRPDTPLPWINYLGCEAYFGMISNTAGGYSFYRDARLRRLTRYRYNNAPLDMGGRYIYLRDDEPAGQPGHFWSPTWQPVRRPLDDYACRHGLGYTTIRSRLAGIQAQTRYFVPLGENLEIWELTLTNQRADDRATSRSSRRSSSACGMPGRRHQFPAQLLDRRGGSGGRGDLPQDRIPRAAQPLCLLRLLRAAGRLRYPARGLPGRVSRLGRAAGGRERAASSNSIAHGWQPIGAHQVKIAAEARRAEADHLPAGLSRKPAGREVRPARLADHQQAHGQAGDRPLPAARSRSSRPSQALRSYWDGLLGKLQVHTPDEHTNRMVNIWNAYQCMVTFNMSRSASYFESGIGRGMGFRDSNQDLLGFVHMVPERARAAHPGPGRHPAAGPAAPTTSTSR